MATVVCSSAEAEDGGNVRDIQLILTQMAPSQHCCLYIYNEKLKKTIEKRRCILFIIISYKIHVLWLLVLSNEFKSAIMFR